MPEAADPLDRIGTALADDLQKANATMALSLQSGVPLIPELGSYLIAAGGKRIRPLLALASSALFHNGHAGAEPRAPLLAAAVEFIHSATLLHDDVVDESKERRGRPSANEVFGNKASILVGDFLFSRAFELMVESGSLPMLQILSRASAEIVEGEVMQLSALNNLDLQQADYIKIISAKTSALFSAACAIGPVLAERPAEDIEAMQKYGHALGLVFQIVDDLLDYTADRAKLGKDLGDDFREGKVTLPVLLSYASGNDNEKLFWQRTITNPANQNNNDLATARDLITTHSTQKCIALAEHYATDARDALTALPQSALRNDLSDLVGFCLTRQS